MPELKSSISGEALFHHRDAQLLVLGAAAGEVGLAAVRAAAHHHAQGGVVGDQALARGALRETLSVEIIEHHAQVLEVIAGHGAKGGENVDLIVGGLGG